MQQEQRGQLVSVSGKRNRWRNPDGGDFVLKEASAIELPPSTGAPAVPTASLDLWNYHARSLSKTALLP